MGILVAKTFYDYLGGKGYIGYEGNSEMKPQNKVLSGATVKPSESNGGEKFAEVGSNKMVLPPTSSNSQNPAELLPHDNNSQWADLNPSGMGELSNINFLDAGYHMGNISEPMKNSNLSIRAEPPNPQVDVGIWNNSTKQIGFEMT